ncbi:xanthine dehydrogenase small subunit [Pararhizobium mangrovi]|uniref:Xanthine dehydrogenase small subunit n=1 Tax=Pararhizobium mangrovi TaxID=2590452 RepID=A0A506U425_9HYPH|nr:xanthine dehydrogenase small subunit [Pararhizobium mangrovi]TPW26627.1 xanthine dehydrogenase small subunit [Pararhizobium mangrovi]
MPVFSRHSIRFLLNDTLVETSAVGPGTTLLDFLRIDKRLTGSKEGCAEGDCGACTVLVGRLVDGEVAYESVNACIRFVASLDATHVVTIEHLSAPDGPLHPVQQAMVDEHSSQCGFCTPGFVMSLYQLWLTNPKPDDYALEKALQGNLCRCTGYAPIIRAGAAMGRTPPEAATDRLTAMRERAKAELERLADGARVDVEYEGGRSIVPDDLDDLAAVLEENPDATIVSGATDVGLWVTKDLRDISPAVFVRHLPEMHRIEETDEGVRLFGCVTYTEAFSVLSKRYDGFQRLLERFGGEQIRNMGTIGGNIANGSPIGDSPPTLIALDAELTLRKGAERRTIPLEDFFIDYGNQDRAPGEFVESVFVPALRADQRFAVYKISKRREEDISALCGAFNVTLDDAGTITAARIAFGGMAATPKRAKAVEAALIGKPLDLDTAEAAREAFETDYQPLSDWRASADYRLLAAKNLLTRFVMEKTGDEAVQIVRHRPALEEA